MIRTLDETKTIAEEDSNVSKPNILDTIKLDKALRLAKQKSKDGQFEEAKAIYEDIIQKFTKNKQALIGLQSLVRGVTAAPQDPPPEQLQLIINYYTQGQLQQALSDISQMLERFPNSAVLYNIAGAANVGLMRFDASIDSFQQALKINPNNAEVYNNMGNALMAKGDLDAAVDSFKQGLKIQPNNAQIYNNLGVALNDKGDPESALGSYKQAIKIKPDYDEAYYNMGIALQKKGERGAAINSYRQALKIRPDYVDAYYNMAVALQSKGDLEAAIDSFKQALEIKPDYAEAYYNMGSALNDKGDSEGAIDSYKQALKIKPDNAEAYYNIGVALQDKDDPEGAIDSYEQALKINPDFAEAYNNMGNALKTKGDPEAAINNYLQALKIKPNYADAQLNLVALLTTYTPKKEHSNLIVTVNEVIRKIDIRDNTSNIISDDQAVDLFSKSSSYVSSSGLELRTELSQTYRRNSVDLNCERHMSVFDTHNIIPEFCFGCYKVQVEPQSIIDLIKLYLVFDQLELNENNSRKCMVELRPAIPGFYKGLIFCASLEQAKQIAEQLDALVKQRICLKLSATVKRGCSEYPIAFPEFKNINPSGPPLMNYPEDWKIIEQDYDKKTYAPPKDVRPSLLGLNLRDVLVIQRWIDYAKGLGDPSANLVNPNPIYDQRIYKIAKTRLDRFSFKS